MAEAFPSLILDSVLKQLDSPIFQRNKLSCCLGIQLRDLRSKLELIRAVIHDAELMGIMFPKFFRHWLCELQQILHELDDLLDEAFIRSMPQPSMVEKVRIHLYNMPFDLKMARKMKSFNERLDGIVKECYKCNLLVVEPGCEKPIARKGILRCDPDSVEDDAPKMIGRDDDKKKVIEMLFEETPELSTVHISGWVGVGKTALCRAVYNDEEVGKHFEARLWFGLGTINELSRTGICKYIITTLNDEAHSHLETEDEDQLVNRVVSLIGMRKILIVYDYCVYSSLYHLITIPFPFYLMRKCRGIKILFSTPSYYKPCYSFVGQYPHHPGFLELEDKISEEHSWHIFHSTSLVLQHDRQEWIQDMGRQIVRKCNGNPALLKGVGTLLNGRDSEDDRAIWEYFFRDFDFSGQLQHYCVMGWPYDTLRVFHQPVSYLSLFSRDDFKFEALINQFVANGFTNVSDELREALKTFFIKPIVTKGDWDDADRYQIMQEVNDEIIQLAGVDSANLGWEETEVPKTSRHVSISRPSSSAEQQGNKVLTNSLIEDAIHRRSLLFLGKWNPIRMSVQNLDRLASNHRYLRVLDLQDLALKELPSSIGKLIHLRYLDLSRNDFRELSRSICRLKSLQTLMLVYCDKLIKLPGRIRSLLHLRHLEVNMCLDLTHFPSRIASLTCLQRLDRFVVGPHRGGLRYLEHLDNLSKHLTIELPRRWKNSVQDAEKANLDRKEGLTSMEYKWQGTYNTDEDIDDYDVLEKLKPYTGIEDISVLNYGGTKFPTWITALQSLTRVTISHCKRCKFLPPFHVFPNLKYLTLTSMLNMEYLQIDRSSGVDASCVAPSASTDFFPSLHELRIGCMPKLRRWSRDLSGMLRSLKAENVEIWKCPSLTVMPPLRTDVCLGGPYVLLQGSYYVLLHDVSKEMLQLLDCGDHLALKIISMNDMVSIPDVNLTNFPMSVEIRDCDKLRMLWANILDLPLPHPEGFQRLRSLSITNCREMKHLSSALMHLIELEDLKISRCSEELDCLHEEVEGGMPWKALQKLRNLIIEGFENFEVVPNGFRYLLGLSILAIKDCKSLKLGLASLPEGSYYLYIISCPGFGEEVKKQRPEIPVCEEEAKLRLCVVGDWLLE